MLKHPDLTERRILNAVPSIADAIYRHRAPVEIEAWHVGGEPVPYEVALQADYKPFSVGDVWGPAWDTTWFRIRGQVPAAWAGNEVVVILRLTDAETKLEGFTAEGLIYSDGRIMRALNINRSDIAVASPSLGCEMFEFYIEAAANVADLFGAAVQYSSSPVFKLAQAELATVDRAAFDFYYDFKIAAELMAALPAESQRKGELRYALNESINLLDLTDPGTITNARNAIAGVLAKKNGDTAHQLSAIGHAHMDTAWLWPLRETIRKCARTFSTAIDYMDRYPEYIFGCSQAQQYAWMKYYYPSIFEGIRERVNRGQWEPIGSMWVEVDCNLASGESLIRQILHGKRFFKEEFNYETKDAWIPDVFGYSAALPQIYVGCGIDFFVTQKISWNQFNKFPHHTFLWEGIDGTRIFSHFPPADTYNGRMDPESLIYNVTNFKEHGRASRSLYVYGFGDGGGGPSVTMLEQSKRLRDLDGLPKVKLEKVIDFAKKAKADARDLPVWVGEIYLELHRGTYTTQARNKRGNRKSEFLLRDAELLDALSLAVSPQRKEAADDPERARYDVTGLGTSDSHRHARALERAWKLVLMNQFHDIIPGSSIGWVYKDSARDYETIAKLGNSVVISSLTAMDEKIETANFEEPIRIANTLALERNEVVELAPGKLATVRVPSLGYTVIDAADGATQDLPTTLHPVSIEEVEGELVIQNGLINLRLGADGLIKSLRDCEAGGREIISRGADGNLFQLHQDTPNAWDAWDIDVFYKERVENLVVVDRLEVVESHPLRSKVRIERSFGKSRIIQDVIITAGSKRIDFVTEVEWHEDHKLLKVAFPVNVLSSRATYEIQFGHVERPTHYNTSWDLARFEVCAQKWADLSEANYGVALLNDCKYGYDIHENVMRLSLLRSPTAPDPTADRGRHLFTYALLPHMGDLRQGRVIEEAYCLNAPLRSDRIDSHGGPLPPYAFLLRNRSAWDCDRERQGCGRWDRDYRSPLRRLRESRPG
ncbi:MAG: alpha-mannosidase [Chthoniobacteraceae bacterium]